MCATHRLRRKLLRGLDGIALDASSVWQLQAVVVLGLRRASRDWHGQRNARASRRVASDGRGGSWAERCGAIRRQPAAVRLGGSCGGRRARASIHTPWQGVRPRRARRRLKRQERAGGGAERRSAGARIGDEPIGSSPRSLASTCSIGGAASILARMSRRHAARAPRADRATALNFCYGLRSTCGLLLCQCNRCSHHVGDEKVRYMY